MVTAEFRFDLQRAAEILAGTTNPKFEFEPEVMAFLLLVWALDPGKSNRVLAAARAMGGIVSVAAINKGSVSRRRQLRAPLEFTFRMAADDWYRTFDSEFMQQVGGLPAILHAPRLRWWRRLIAAELRRLRVSLDLVDCAIKLYSIAPKLATRANAIACIEHNIFAVKDNYGVRQGEKRAQIGNENGSVSRKTAEKAWDRAPPSIVLLYALTVEAKDLLMLNIANVGFLYRLQCVVREGSLARALALFESVASAFDGCINQAGAFKRYHPVRVECSVSVPLPRFSTEQTALANAIIAKLAQPKRIGSGRETTATPS